jgi:uncharacterized protein YigA (DUF484 family)
MQKHIDKLESLMSTEGQTAVTTELLHTLRDMDGKLGGLQSKIQEMEKNVAVISAHVEDNKHLQDRVQKLELQLARMNPDQLLNDLKTVTETSWKIQIKMAGFSAVSAGAVVGLVELVKLLTQ